MNEMKWMKIIVGVIEIVIVYFSLDFDCIIILGWF